MPAILVLVLIFIILLILVLFAGGVLAGLKLSTISELERGNPL